MARYTIKCLSTKLVGHSEMYNSLGDLLLLSPDPVSGIARLMLSGGQ